MELSADDVYKAMGSKELATYNKEVTGLRELGLLQAIRTSLQASSYAKLNNIPKSKVPRFKVSIPT